MADITEPYMKSIEAARSVYYAASKFQSEAEKHYHDAIRRYLINMPDDDLEQFLADNLILALFIGLSVSRSEYTIGWIEPYFDYYVFNINDMVSYFRNLFPEDTDYPKEKIEFISGHLYELLKRRNLYEVLQFASDYMYHKNIGADFIEFEAYELGKERCFFAVKFLDFYKKVAIFLHDRIESILESGFEGRSVGVLSIVDFEFTSFYEETKCNENVYTLKDKDPETIRQFIDKRLKQFAIRGDEYFETGGGLWET